MEVKRRATKKPTKAELIKKFAKKIDDDECIQLGVDVLVMNARETLMKYYKDFPLDRMFSNVESVYTAEISRSRGRYQYERRERDNARATGIFYHDKLVVEYRKAPHSATIHSGVLKHPELEPIVDKLTSFFREYLPAVEVNVNVDTGGSFYLSRDETKKWLHNIGNEHIKREILDMDKHKARATTHNNIFEGLVDDLYARGTSSSLTEDMYRQYRRAVAEAQTDMTPAVDTVDMEWPSTAFAPAPRPARRASDETTLPPDFYF